jgi:hypothetical protein
MEKTSPLALHEAVEYLLLNLDFEELNAIGTMQESELIGLHFSLGSMIRDLFGLNRQNSPFLKNCPANNPDDASMLIIRQLWGVISYSKLVARAMPLSRTVH